MKAHSVVVVGSGRLGGAIARGLSEWHWPVSGWVRTSASRRRWKALKIPCATDATLHKAEIVFFAVPDDEIAPAAGRLHSIAGAQSAFVHGAGALTLEVLRRASARRAVGSFHPLCAVSSADDSLTGHWVAVNASTRALDTKLTDMAAGLGLVPLTTSERHRDAYHAGAVMAAGGVVALLSAAVEAWRQAGIPSAKGLQALLPLTRSALRGVEGRGLRRGLTGPVARGDVARLNAHLQALPRHLAPLYRELSRQALALVKKR